MIQPQLTQLQTERDALKERIGIILLVFLQ
jgi:hypothetical protein